MKPRKEIFDEILPSLPLNFFENRLDSRLHIVPMHWHDRLEIIRVVDGEGVLSLDLQEHPLQAGDIVTIMPGALHAIRGGRTVLHSRTVTFSTRILEDWTPVHFIPLIHTDMPGSAAFLHTMDALFQLRLQPDNGCESILRHYLAAWPLYAASMPTMAISGRDCLPSQWAASLSNGCCNIWSVTAERS